MKDNQVCYSLHSLQCEKHTSFQLVSRFQFEHPQYLNAVKVINLTDLKCNEYSYWIWFALAAFPTLLNQSITAIDLY